MVDGELTMLLVVAVGLRTPRFMVARAVNVIDEWRPGESVDDEKEWFD